MNFFAHGRCFVDRPYFLAGTAIPDWLAVADRKTRLRSRQVKPFIDDSASIQAEIAAGVQQHLDDDRRFHRSRAFVETSTELTRSFCLLLGETDDFRPAFLGHIVTELLLDAVLIEEAPAQLQAYYEAIGEIDPQRTQQAVNRMARKPTVRLAPWIPHFLREQFLWDYRRPEGLRFRLNQVLGRVKLKPLPPEAETVLQTGWTTVRERTADLLPEGHDIQGLSP